jgi:hypothetical protein
MTWPASDIDTTYLDAGGDSAATARANILDLAQKFNLLRNHVTSFMQGLLTRTTAAGLRTDLQLDNHQLVTVDASGNVSTTGTIQGSNISMTSDERLKEAWAGIPVDFVERLANVKAGTFQFKTDTAGKRHAGVSAQSLRDLLPEAVIENSEGFLSVTYGNAALVACIMLAREVEELRHQVRQFKGEP